MESSRSGLSIAASPASLRLLVRELGRGGGGAEYAPLPAGRVLLNTPAGRGLTVNDTTFYETPNMMLRGETVKYLKQKAKRSRAVEAIILSDISAAEAKFIATGAQSEALHLDMLKSKLEEHRSPITDGLIVRSRVSWHEHGNGAQNISYR